jgi:uncharacterized protein (TIGR03067 family)
MPDPQGGIRPQMFDRRGMKGAVYYIFQQVKPNDAEQGKKPKVNQPGAKKDDMPKPDKEQLQGTWKIVSGVEDGKKDMYVGGEWTFKGTTIKAVFPANPYSGAVTEYFRFRLDETTNPKAIDLVHGKADDLFDTAKFDKRFDKPDERKEGIYSITRDKLAICVSGKKGERPTAFESKKGSDCFLIVLKREPDDDEKIGNKP